MVADTQYFIDYWLFVLLLSSLLEWDMKSDSVGLSGPGKIMWPFRSPVFSYFPYLKYCSHAISKLDNLRVSARDAISIPARIYRHDEDAQNIIAKLIILFSLPS